MGALACAFERDTQGGTGDIMNMNSATEQQIVRGINENSIDDEDLVGRETWKRICQVRGRNLNSVDPAAWQSLWAMSRSVLNGEAVAAPGFCICQTH